MISRFKELEEEAKAFESNHDEQSVFAIAVAVIGFQVGEGYHLNFINEKVRQPYRASDETEAVRRFLLTQSGEPLNYTEHEERITQYPSTHLMHFQDFGPTTGGQPYNLDYIDPDAKYIELNPESRPGYSRLYP